jgi:hypothetical protein
VLAARATAPEHRGEALSIYYVATASALAIGPPLGFALYGAAGMRASLLVAAALVCAVGPLAWSLRERAAEPVPGARLGFTLVSRHALAAAGTMTLTTIGHSSVYAFLPLYAIAGGMGSGVGWFYTLYSAWLIACRVLFRRASDRLGRPRVVAASIGVVTLAYVVLALPPSALSLAVAALLLGSGSALLYPTMVALLVDRTPEAERGLAIGTLSGSWDVGVVIGSSSSASRSSACPTPRVSRGGRRVDRRPRRICRDGAPPRCAQPLAGGIVSSRSSLTAGRSWPTIASWSAGPGSTTSSPSTSRFHGTARRHHRADRLGHYDDLRVLSDRVGVPAVPPVRQRESPRRPSGRWSSLQNPTETAEMLYGWRAASASSGDG